MAEKKRRAKKQETEVQDYWHEDATRRNTPPAGIASHGEIVEQPRQVYAVYPRVCECESH